MIKNVIPLSLAEVGESIKGVEDEKKELKAFLKKFAKLDAKEASELRKELEGTGIIKLKPENIVKIIDFLPEDASDINKIFIDTSLDENESAKIIEIVKKYR
ncbi:MAG TPA: hypothetical protein VJA86_02140 [Candidatus Nanoarchaeia archaeon]|nr:hypothetical protein [Candidatus Nanoarchaeia archaeon]